MPMPRHTLTQITLTLLCLITVICGTAGPATAQADRVTAVPQAALNTLESTQQGFRSVYRMVGPAVVQITSTSDVTSSGTRQQVDPLNQPRRETSSGSGVIIREDGIVLTNSHVVRNAKDVKVRMRGVEKEYPAEVVQTDPRTDLAIVRITERGTYPTARLGDAQAVQVGDWAIAIGSPFGKFTSTMTIGIISATGRALRSPDQDYNFNDLLQTDASINPGNSGGPLCNIRGEVVGINFMIYSPGDNTGNVGIGFAIPINENTKRIIDTLVAGRSVERGRMGIAVKELDETMRDDFSVPADLGVLVDSVMAGMAADKAGLKAEDVILEYNGERVKDVKSFIMMVERTQPGTRVPVVVLREGKRQAVTVIMGSDVATNPVEDEKRFGLSVVTITPHLAEMYHLPVAEGVAVTGVAMDSAAEEGGLERGDIILRVGRDMVKSEEEFWTSMAKSAATAKRGVILRVQRGALQTTITMPLPTK